MERVIIIAEIGECFNGELEAAKKLIRVAKETGCDIVKFQTLDYENISDNDPERDWFKKIALSPDKITLLKRWAGEIGMEVLFTPENIKTASWLVEIGCIDVKISSSTIIDLEFLRYTNKHFERIFLSTGMAELSEVDVAVQALSSVKSLYVMHCISEYPTGPLLAHRGLKAVANEDVNFNMMRILMERYPRLKIGYSDHTAGILAPIVAVAMGAKVIEKHITLDRQAPVKNFVSGATYLGTDHILSLEPDELRQMVTQIREAEKMFGALKWKRSEGENILKDFLRKRFHNAKS